MKRERGNKGIEFGVVFGGGQEQFKGEEKCRT